MMISHEKKLIFIHVHRTAGTSFSNMLREKLNDGFEPSFQHANAMTVEADFFEEYRNYYKFGFTRNPWARILSWYSLIHLNDQKSLAEERSRLEEFIEFDQAADFTELSFHYNTLDYFTNKKGELMVDTIYRYENLHQEINTIVDQLNLPPIEIPTINATNPKDYRDYYTDKSRGLLAQKCKKDIDYFHYTF